MAKKKKNKKQKKALKLAAKAEKAELAKAEKEAKKEKKKDGKSKVAKDGSAEEKPTVADPATVDKKGDKKMDGKKSRKVMQEQQQQYVSPFSEDADEGQFGFGEDQAADLADLEHMLNVEVEPEFFVEPRFFHTLSRVINVLGLQLNDDAKEDLSGKSLLERNPAYQGLQKQAQVVENAIEHMSRVYCNALNRSVIQVGRIAREFDEAIDKVESLRQQVEVIQETIGARSRASASANQDLVASNKEGGKKKDADDQVELVVASTPATHMSLRELWMKKLESEALLSLIKKMNIVRDAPGRFDDLTSGDHKNCRIGAATRCLTEALQTMFSDDISQVDALSQILENLMIRKATASQILWETLEDILYLRTANGPVLEFEMHDPQQHQFQPQSNHQNQQRDKTPQDTTGDPHTLQKSVSFGADNQEQGTGHQAVVLQPTRRIFNPFHKNHVLLCVKDTDDTDDISIDSEAADPEDDFDEPVNNKENPETPRIKRSMSAASDLSDDTEIAGETNDADGRRHSRKMMIPRSVVESEVDLVGDELRCFDFETKDLSKIGMQERFLPRYTDPVLSLRIMVECLARVGQLEFAESILIKNVETEIKNIIQREQARTFHRLDRRKPSQTIKLAAKDAGELKDFRRHFTAVLSSLGCIMMRLSHLAQISRTRIVSH